MGITEYGELGRRTEPLTGAEPALKRGLDLLLSAIFLAASWPVFFVIALLIVLDSSGSIFYRQRRVGMRGQPFEMLKFRTMQPDAEQRLIAHLNHDIKVRREWDLYQKLASDPRITRVGKWLRRWSLDELPQFINVLRGEMSLVGPRPIFFGQEADYGGELENYLRVRPGLTGLWQISGRNRLTFRERARLDGEYVRNWSILQDLIILAKTPRAVLTGEGSPVSNSPAE